MIELFELVEVEAAEVPCWVKERMGTCFFCDDYAEDCF